MKPSSSSTSSSDARAVRQALGVLGYTLAWLVLFDVAVGAATRLPADPRLEPSALQRYFDYGRTVEGKLRYMVKDTRETSAPITITGWVSPAYIDNPKTAPSSADHVLVAAYGQSFTAQLLDALHALDPRFEGRMVGGPGAPLSHSFALYRADRESHRAQVVVMGVLASALSQLTSLTNMTTMFEAPQPYTYPRFVLRGGKLEAIESEVRTYEDLRATLADPARLGRFERQLAENDAAYDPLTFEQDWLDASTLGRAVRRGFGQKHARDLRARFVDRNGFTNYEQVIDVAEAILATFAAEVRRDGQIPYVLLINDRGFNDYLYRALAPRLDRIGVPYFSTHERAPATEAGLFLKDGHFQGQINAELAAEWRKALRSELERRGPLNVKAATAPPP